MEDSSYSKGLQAQDQQTIIFNVVHAELSAGPSLHLQSMHLECPACLLRVGRRDKACLHVGCRKVRWQMKVLDCKER